MDMNISMRDKKILLMFLGVGVFAAGYFFGYRPQMEEAQSIRASTEPLKTRLDDLLKLAADRDFYLKETEDINAKVSEYTSAFPADIRPEDGIVRSHEYGEFPGYADIQCRSGHKRVCGFPGRKYRRSSGRSA
ncbi:MAG: hypothetical protein ACLT8I_17105 [Blautia faecis]